MCASVMQKKLNKGFIEIQIPGNLLADKRRSLIMHKDKDVSPIILSISIYQCI